MAEIIFLLNLSEQTFLIIQYLSKVQFVNLCVKPILIKKKNTNTDNTLKGKVWNNKKINSHYVSFNGAASEC